MGNVTAGTELLEEKEKQGNQECLMGWGGSRYRRGAWGKWNQTDRNDDNKYCVVCIVVCQMCVLRLITQSMAYKGRHMYTKYEVIQPGETRTCPATVHTPPLCFNRVLCIMGNINRPCESFLNHSK